MQDKETLNLNRLEANSKRKNIIYRWILYFILGIFVFYYLTPLYVMIVTSFKTMPEIRQGNLFSLPESIKLDAWKQAWDGAGFTGGDVILKPYFWNSIKLVVPAVVISTLFGAINGYALTKWRFKGDSYIFLLFLFGTFIPLLLNRFKIDAALATGPFITTANDVIGLIIYFQIGRLIIGY